MADAVLAASAPVAASNSSAAQKKSVSGNVKAKAGVRGTAASHRPWKQVQTRKFSTMNRPKAAGGAKRGLAFQEQQARKTTMTKARNQMQQMREARQAEIAERRERQLEKERRRAENQLKGASYQVISDPTKLKKMTKKQLRQIKKTRVNKDGVMELVPAYAK